MFKKFLMILMSAVMGISIFGCGPPQSGGAPTNPNPPQGDDSGGIKPNPNPSQPEPEYPESDYSRAEKLDFTLKSVSGTDALGRFTDSAGEFDESKQVGIFYFLWMKEANHDISKLSLDAIKNDRSTAGQFHYWGEPLYGYYDSADEWVFRKHLELFVNAGIDYIFFDVTNGLFYYTEVIDKLLPVAFELYEQGFPVPKLAFYCNTDSKDTVTALYNEYYKPGTEKAEKYKDLWYRHKDTDNANSVGKPWIAARTNYGKGQDFSDCSAEIKDFFYLKAAQWPNEPGGANFENGMPWMSWEADGKAQHNHNGIMSVSIAQHTSGAFSDAVLQNNRKLGRGRGWDAVSKTNVESNVALGTNFDWQWQNVYDQGDKVNNVFVTGWNEWIAQKQADSQRDTCYFVDLYNEEFSRDAEMLKGGYGDNYYMQLVHNIRKFKQKGNSAAQSFDSRKLELDGDEAQWNQAAAYLDFAGDTAKRNHRSANVQVKGNYTDSSGRNDIAEIRVAHDGDYLYFRIVCGRAISSRRADDRGWMNILIEVDGLSGASWNNYHYVVNRTEQNGELKVERLNSDGSGKVCGTAETDLFYDTLTVRIAREDIGLTGSNKTIRFKAADNVTNLTDIMDYYITGDCAPIGRLSYTYRIK